jgi:hypothetical protein
MTPTNYRSLWGIETMDGRITSVRLQHITLDQLLKILDILKG